MVTLLLQLIAVCPYLLLSVHFLYLLAFKFIPFKLLHSCDKCFSDPQYWQFLSISQFLVKCSPFTDVHRILGQFHQKCWFWSRHILHHIALIGFSPSCTLLTLMVVMSSLASMSIWLVKFFFFFLFMLMLIDELLILLSW